MTTWIYFSVVLSAFIFTSVSGTTLTLPTSITLGGEDPASLNGTCRPPSGSISVFSIIVGRRVQGVDTRMAWTYLASNTGQAVTEILDTSLSDRLTITGTTSPAASAELEYSLRDLTCDDATTYYCITQFIPPSAGSTETSLNVTALVLPEDIKMAATPNYDIYDPVTEINLNCSGYIGNDFPSDQSMFWKWEWRNTSLPESQRIWYPITENITYQSPTPDGCTYSGGSSYIITTAEDDNGKEIRCYIVDSDLYSASKTVYIRAPTLPTTESADVSTSTDDVRTTEGADVSSRSSSSSSSGSRSSTEGTKAPENPINGGEGLSARLSPITLLIVRVSVLMLSRTQPW